MINKIIIAKANNVLDDCRNSNGKSFLIEEVKAIISKVEDYWELDKYIHKFYVKKEYTKRNLLVKAARVIANNMEPAERFPFEKNEIIKIPKGSAKEEAEITHICSEDCMISVIPLRENAEEMRVHVDLVYKMNPKKINLKQRDDEPEYIQTDIFGLI
ncbi:hypothetical protein [Halobacillus litoralis]|uniref:Uncharacterized protein n=1 Tax=Halobacillus litoralis TaxID=45668 RepID=A0A410MJ56_9BACI|nr:hypothetical protein [Halobacillus litoralis]QAS54762.1 hypothetical protein HLI_21125 [Halobacillus litoralis]